MPLIHEVKTSLGLPFRRIKKILNKPMLKAEDQISDNDYALLKNHLKITEIKELTKSEKKKKIRQREKAKDNSPKQENPYAAKGATKDGKIIVIRTPMGGKVR